MLHICGISFQDTRFSSLKSLGGAGALSKYPLLPVNYYSAINYYTASCFLVNCWFFRSMSEASHGVLKTQGILLSSNVINLWMVGIFHWKLLAYDLTYSHMFMASLYYIRKEHVLSGGGAKGGQGDMFPPTSHQNQLSNLSKLDGEMLG